MITHGWRTAAVLLCILLEGSVVSAAGSATPETVYYVSPRGNDAAAGTLAAPFRTPARAQQAVRAEIARGLRQPVRVSLAAADYYLTAPLVLGPEDSGTEQCPVTWSGGGGPVCLSGGRRITGWARQQGDLWAASVPWAQGQPFPQLWVDGQRATLARFPHAGADPPYLTVTLSDLSADFTSFRLGFGPGKLPALSRPSDAEVVTLGNWALCRDYVSDFDPTTGALTLAPPHVPVSADPWNWGKVGRWGFVQGAREFLGEPGEWCLDRAAGTVSYQARPGEDLTRATVVAGVLPQVLVLQGTPERSVRYLNFHGLQFSHTAWQPPPGGYFGHQACHFATAAAPGKVSGQEVTAGVRAVWAAHCTWDDVRVEHMGGSGLYLAEGCRDCLVSRSTVSDIGGNGLNVAGPNDPAKLVQDNTLINNVVAHGGIECYGAVGIFVGITAATTVAHNEVYDWPYTGISVGWQWNPQPTACRDNVIEYNHIHDVMQRLCDGGGIYSLGFQPGTVMRGNLIHDIKRSPYAQGAPNNGFFLDEGSKGFLLEANAVYRTSGEPVRHNANKPEWHTWKDNSFGSEPAPGTPAALAAAQAGPEPIR